MLRSRIPQAPPMQLLTSYSKCRKYRGDTICVIECTTPFKQHKLSKAVTECATHSYEKCQPYEQVSVRVKHTVFVTGWTNESKIKLNWLMRLVYLLRMNRSFIIFSFLCHMCCDSSGRVSKQSQSSRTASWMCQSKFNDRCY